MRWLCFLLLASPLLMSAAAAQTSGQPRPKSLQFDIAQVPATRDSFVFRLRGEERGWAVWQYEIRRLETTQEVVYSATSEFRPVEEERLRIVVDRLTGQPLSTFHHIDLFSPRSDTVMVEHDLEGQREDHSREPALRPRHRALGLRIPRGRRLERHAGRFAGRPGVQGIR